eukprot:gene5918-6604_t
MAAGKEVFDLIQAPVTCHAFNKDKTRVAFSPNDHTVLIYKKVGNKWEKESVLEEHGQTVTSVDWAPNSNRIVSCGVDRNAYVWKEQDGVWKPTLVIVRINRAATFVKWSPNEDKFAVASGARLISVCYFEKENDWWVSKHIKKPIRSTVCSLDWHPNNVLIAAGSTDFKARIFSGYIKEIESKPTETCWGKKMPFGNCMVEFSNGGGGWVHSVAFSPSGNKLAWVGHDSSISYVSGDTREVKTLRGNFLPFLSCVWFTENTLAAAGHDFLPMVFAVDGNGELSFVAKLDAAVQKEAEAMSAMAKFRSMDKQALGTATTKSVTTHANSIKQLSVYEAVDGSVSKISSCGMDGRVVIWHLKTLESALADLKIV